MPSGPKKRKAAKRKLMTIDVHPDGSPMNPNPETEFLSPMLPPPPQGSVRENRRMALIEDEETLETFETPRFQPDTPRLTETPYFSMENVRSARRGEMERLSEAAVLIGDKFKGLRVETTPKERESPKLTKLDESFAVVAADAEDPDGSSSKEVKLDAPVVVASDEELLRGDELGSPKASIEAVDVLSSNEKEAKVVPWTEETKLAENRALDDDIDAIQQGAGPFIAFRKSIEEELNGNKVIRTINGNVDVDGVRYDGEGFTDFKRITERESLLNRAEEVDNVVESIPKTLPQSDLHLTNNKLEKSVEKSPVPIENLEDAKSEVAQRNEVAGGPIVARRATVWNCCGLFEVFTSRDR